VIVWRQSHITPGEPAPLWHFCIGTLSGKYVMACGYKASMAGSSFMDRIPGNACLKCSRVSKSKLVESSYTRIADAEGIASLQRAKVINYLLCKECGQPILKPGQKREDPESYRHASGCTLDDFVKLEKLKAKLDREEGRKV
jgi:hypothetical protein